MQASPRPRKIPRRKAVTSNVEETAWIDANGQRWSTRLTLGDAKRMKEAGQDIMSGEFLKGLFGDPLVTVETIAECLRSQWTERGLTYEQFADLILDSDVSFLKAKEAFKRGLTDFFQRLGLGAEAELVNKSAAIAGRMQSTMLSRVNSEKMTEFLSAAEKKAVDVFDDEINKEIAKLIGT
jgi:hypothetical protein